jgi:hypothetical protein
MFSIAARFHVLIWVAWTPNFFDSSKSVISSRIASSATLALNSGAWFFLVVILDRLSLQAIHLNNWSEIPRPPLALRLRFGPAGLGRSACQSARRYREALLTGPPVGK